MCCVVMTTAISNLESWERKHACTEEQEKTLYKMSRPKSELSQTVSNISKERQKESLIFID